MWCLAQSDLGRKVESGVGLRNLLTIMSAWVLTRNPVLLPSKV